MCEATYEEETHHVEPSRWSDSISPAAGRVAASRPHAVDADVIVGRRTLPNGVAYALATAVIGLGLFASLTPVSVPAVLAGVVVSHLGLRATFETFGSVVVAIALVVAFEAWRTRPTPNRSLTVMPVS